MAITFRARITTMLFCCTALAASPAEWRNRSIYQIMTDRFARSDGSLVAKCNVEEGKYCGGSWRGITQRLDYIQDMGFDAICISPITQNIEGATAYGEAYHGYWQQDLYSLNTHFGTSDDLKQLGQALHSRGMFLMVDVVVNHNGWGGSVDAIDFSAFKPFDQESDYNMPYCEVAYGDFSNIVTECWAGDRKVPLPDLKTTDQRVRRGYSEWISHIVSTYSIDGLRLDTVRHVEKSFWKGFNTAANNTYTLGEIFDGSPGAVCDYQDSIHGVLDYPSYFPLLRAFESPFGDISKLAHVIDEMQVSCRDMSLVGAFSENHDNPRFPSKSDNMILAKNVIAFTVLTGGIPIIYQGQEQHYRGSGDGNDPYNREALWGSKYDQSHELYTHIARLNKIRRTAIAENASFVFARPEVLVTDPHTIAIKRADLLVILSNRGSRGSNISTSVRSQYDPGSLATEMFTCQKQTVGAGGVINVLIEDSLPRIFYPSARANVVC